MNKGKIIAEGEPKNLIEQYDSEENEKGNLENVFLHLTGEGISIEMISSLQPQFSRSLS